MDVMHMKRITIYSWGYYGWGKVAHKFVEAVDQLEKQRGFVPPLFVDVRIRRTVRAFDFQNNHFRNIVGEERYQWVPELGNKDILRKRKRGIEIANPEAAEDLLDLAIRAAKKKQHVIFFCSCQFPKHDGEVACHRVTVGDLLLEAASRRSISLEIVEWPGGELQGWHFTLNSAKELFQFSKSKKLHVEENGSYEGLTLGSVIDVSFKNVRQQNMAGPMIWKKNKWLLPMMDSTEINSRIEQLYEEEARRLQFDYGYNPRRNVVEDEDASVTGAEYEFNGKAISVKEPWGSAIVFGGKDTENRTVQTHYRGPIAIHASLSPWMNDLEDTIQQTVNGPVRTVREWIAEGLRKYGIDSDPIQLQPGCIIGIGTLVDCVEESESPWHGYGSWGYKLTGTIPIKPMPWKGNLGLWKCRFKYRPLLPRTK